jgi:hypothetical protein
MALEMCEYRFNLFSLLLGIINKFRGIYAQLL